MNTETPLVARKREKRRAQMREQEKRLQIAQEANEAVARFLDATWREVVDVDPGLWMYFEAAGIDWRSWVETYRTGDVDLRLRMIALFEDFEMKQRGA